MRYYFLRLLALLKATVGYLTTKLATVYNKLGELISSGIEKETTRIIRLKEKNVNKAKQAVIDAARIVLALEENVAKVETKESVKADAKLFKLKTKVK